MSSRPFSQSAFREAARSLASISHRLYQQGLSPATSSNYSIRLNEQCCAITVSGKDKGLLNESDIMVVDFNGGCLTDGKPSAETGLHTQLYRRFDDIGAVLHTHSLAATVLTLQAAQDASITLSGYELLKALEGVDTHDTDISIPIFDNTQDIDALGSLVEQHMSNAPNSDGPAYLIRGHGLYTWATDMASCFRQVEALEFLLKAYLQRKQLGDW